MNCVFKLYVHNRDLNFSAGFHVYETDNGTFEAFYGLAYKSPRDQFSRKMARNVIDSRIKSGWWRRIKYTGQCLSKESQLLKIIKQIRETCYRFKHLERASDTSVLVDMIPS